MEMEEREKRSASAEHMSYKEAMEFLEETKKYGSQLGLKSIQTLLSLLGDVQEHVPVVHIGGTNGKGSVGAMLSEVLSQAGYRVGRFATPDVFSYEEEFLMNGKPIAKERLAALFSAVAMACQKMTDSGCTHPTRFEVETAAAYLWFYEEACDVALVEVGMGGATDATNVIQKPLLSILTSISPDHMQFLGDSLTKIAEVKCGIIKKDCPVVTVRQQEEVQAIIRKYCAEQNVPCVYADTAKKTAQAAVLPEQNVCFDWRRKDGTWMRQIKTGLKGAYQLENTLCALEALQILEKQFPKIGEKQMRQGIANASWPGRFEKIGSCPDFYLDGAHNEGAVTMLRKTLDAAFAGRRLIYIMGVLADKDYQKMIRIMFRPGDIVFTVTPKNRRGLDGTRLAEQLRGEKIKALYCENGRDAVLCSLREAKQEDVILAFGSLSYLSEIRQAYEDL